MPLIPARIRKFTRRFFNRYIRILQQPLVPVLSPIVRIAPRLFVNIPDNITQNIVVESKKLVFIPLPKVGSTTFMNGFTDLRRREGIDFKIVECAVADIYSKKPEYHDYFLATFVRNPFSRVVSTYLHQIKDPLPSIQVRLFSRFREKGLSPGMSFQQFVEWLSGPEGVDEYSDKHWISQNVLLGYPEMEGRLEFVGKLENVADDFTQFTSIIGIAGYKLPGAGVQKTSDALHGQYRDHYNDHLKKLVAKRYEKDLDLFKYTF